MRRMLLLCMLAAPALCQAATLKPFTTLSGGVVRLSDLFDGADGRPLGPGPLPGGQIVVGSAQLGAIARMFGVDWSPTGPGDQAVLQRPGRSLTKDEVMKPLRAELATLGAVADSDIELPGLSTPPLPVDPPPTLSFSGTEFDAASGRFTTLLTIAAREVPQIEMRLSGRVQAMVELPVARHALRAGDVLAADDLEWTRLRTVLAQGALVTRPEQAVGQALRHPVQPGQPIRLADLGRPIVVVKGTPLMLQLDGPGISVTGRGIAAEPGGMGDLIHVINPASRAVIVAEVTGPGQARVVPGREVVGHEVVGRGGVGRAAYGGLAQVAVR